MKCSNYRGGICSRFLQFQCIPSHRALQFLLEISSRCGINRAISRIWSEEPEISHSQQWRSWDADLRRKDTFFPWRTIGEKDTAMCKSEVRVERRNCKWAPWASARHSWTSRCVKKFSGSDAAGSE